MDDNEYVPRPPEYSGKKVGCLIPAEEFCESGKTTLEDANISFGTRLGMPTYEMGRHTHQ